MKRTDSSGFTITELIIAVAVLAILVSVAAPSFVEMMNKQRVKGAAEAVFSDLQLARMEAIKRNTDIALSLQGAGSETWCYALTDNANGLCDCTTANSCQVNAVNSRIVDSSLFSQVSLTTTLVGASSAFSPIRGTANAGTVSLSADGNTIQVVISALGRIRICSDDISGYPSC